MLKNIGPTGPATAIQQAWETYAQSLGDAPPSPGDYQSCYPDALVMSLAGHVQRACERLGLHKATDPLTGTEPSGADAVNLRALINKAWSLFLADATAYMSWEEEKIESLRAILTKPS